MKVERTDVAEGLQEDQGKEVERGLIGDERARLQPVRICLITLHHEEVRTAYPSNVVIAN